MINQTNSNPWVRLRVLLMLPALAFSVIVSSASKSDFAAPDVQDVNKVSIVDESGNKSTAEVVWTATPEEEDVFMVVEDGPEYPGGTEALLAFLKANINYPKSCKDEKIQGRVIVSFVVEKDGTVTSAQVVKGVHPEMDAEALRVIGTMPAWKPGKQRGKEVRVKFTVPVNFKLD